MTNLFLSTLNLCDFWQQQFEVDFPECSKNEQVGFSREDHKFIEIVTDSLKLEKGHYSIGLHLRNKDVCMPDNKIIAEQRALNLKKRLKKDVSLHSEYTVFIKDINSKGYAERVLAEDLGRSDGKVWYIPHHGVYHPQKGKLCVVFDCGATFQGMSLNNQLLQGPDLTSSLNGVITRFRKESCDHGGYRSHVSPSAGTER